MGTAIKHSVLHRLNLVCRHRLLCSCTHMATVVVKGIYYTELLSTDGSDEGVEDAGE